MANRPDTPIGRLTWDTANDGQGGYFPDPATKLAMYKNNDGVGIMLIEESLIGRNTQSWTDLNTQGSLVRDGCASCDPTLIDKDTDPTDNDFVGDVRIMDWTNTARPHWRFDHRRLVRRNCGVLGP